MQALSAVYGAAATWRRRWYAVPSRARHLSAPVISVGNLRVGGSGKTPVVASVARLLQALGEQPAVLSRGYAREKVAGGVTVVSDRDRVLADVAHAGDEPMLLARMLPGVPVLVCADRHAAGVEAETRFGVTAHILDDGFQHVRLARNVDLLLADEHDLNDRVLPAGRLREPLANAAVAHALIVPRSDDASRIGERLGIDRVFWTTRRLGACRVIAGTQVPDRSTPVFAVAGIARPERFFDDLRADGFMVRGSLAFPDHHRFRPSDIARIVAGAGASGAAAVVTTEKDAMRLMGLDLRGVPFAAVPLDTTIEPAGAFASWLTERLAAAKGRKG